MSHSADVRNSTAPSPAGAARGLLRWVTCHNPFYVISAGLFLVGLTASFEARAGEVETWMLMGGLAGYTLLLALTALLLVRYARDWEDLRTVLLLVVLMFLATSVTFDEVLIEKPDRGAACYLIGLAFTILVSEGVLRGIRLSLPAWFRVPYYLILTVFFLYPLALSPFVADPHSEVLMWGLFGFSSVAGLVFLTLLPAIRRGPPYVQGNGSPWPWPLYPWVLFGLLGLAVPARAYLLCWSMHSLPAIQYDRLIFGLYFLIPFGLAVIVLLMEVGLVSYSRGLLCAALAAPLGLVGLALVGQNSDPIYQEFLDLFTARLGGNPLYLTVLASAGFYAYATLRRVPLATDGLTAALVALAFIGSDSVGRDAVDPQAAALALLAAGALQFFIGCWRRNAWRCLLAAEGLVATAALLLPAQFWADPLSQAVVFHLALAGVLVVGGVFRDSAARLLRSAGAAIVLVSCLLVVFGPQEALQNIPAWAVVAYPAAMAVLLAAYGKLLGHRISVRLALVVAACWLMRVSWWGYLSVRQLVVGMDQIALSLALFALALLISLGKAGLLTRWLVAWGWRRPAPVASGQSGEPG